MCLNLLTEPKDRRDFVYEKDKNGENIGYKVFIKEKTGLKSFYMHGKFLPEGEWIDEVDYRLWQPTSRIPTFDSSYPKGWHIFVKEEHALEFLGPAKTSAWWVEHATLRRVKFRTVRRRGYEVDWKAPCVVAKYMLIEENHQKNERKKST